MKKIFKIIFSFFLVLILVLGIFYFFFPEKLYQVTIYLERHRAGLSPKHLTADDFEWPYLEGGQGDTLLLLHGFGGDKDNWVRMAKFLTPYYHVIIPDLPGFGENKKDPALSYAVKDQVKRLDHFAQAIKLNTFYLVGSSMGGHIAASYAAEHPDPILGLILIAPGGLKSAPASIFEQYRQKGDNFLLIKDEASFERMLSFLFYHRPFIPKPLLKYLTQRAIDDQSFQAKLS
ncbi:MAG: alpha/beta fold hydrolase [Deltaproteobacteria bacterium]|nr:alpha/beta fold hydrolase [Deltaproteobacteria bacterium]